MFHRHKLPGKAEATLIGVYLVSAADCIYLIELMINESPAAVDLSHYLQKGKTKNRYAWQAPYDERYLDPSGERVIGDASDRSSLPGASTRVVFFMYLESLEQPLSTPYGELPLREVKELPPRLRQIKFTPID